jgi:ABC-type glycerol-3-phosphate transport system permease component
VSRGRRVALASAGQALALVLLSPYLVMLFTAVKPAAELRATPPVT